MYRTRKTHPTPARDRDAGEEADAAFADEIAPVAPSSAIARVAAGFVASSLARSFLAAAAYELSFARARRSIMETLRRGRGGSDGLILVAARRLRTSFS